MPPKRKPPGQHGQPEPGFKECPACCAPLPHRVIASMDKAGVWDELLQYSMSRIMIIQNDPQSLRKNEWRKARELFRAMANGKVEIVDWAALANMVKAMGEENRVVE